MKNYNQLSIDYYNEALIELCELVYTNDGPAGGWVEEEGYMVKVFAQSPKLSIRFLKEYMEGKILHNMLSNINWYFLLGLYKTNVKIEVESGFAINKIIMRYSFVVAISNIDFEKYIKPSLPPAINCKESDKQRSTSPISWQEALLQKEGQATHICLGNEK
jgi:hypothetical protein